MSKIPYYSRRRFAQSESFYMSEVFDESKTAISQLGRSLSYKESKLSLKDLDYNNRADALGTIENNIIKKRPYDTKYFRDNKYCLCLRTISNYLTGPGKYDYNYQDMIGYLIDSLCMEGLLNKYIDDIETIQYGPFSNVFRLKYSNYPFCIVKTSHLCKSDDVMHEAIIGMYAINKVRSKVPNFMHTYGTFFSGIPVVDGNIKAIAWCQNHSNATTYVVMENIYEGVPLSKMMETMNEEDFLSIYLQVLNALNVAYKMFDFTHYDLHPGNVLIQKLGYYINIPLYLQNGEIKYIKTYYLARIIDYGLSHAFIDGIHFGNYDLRNSNIDGESSFPMHDAYKLLFGCYFYASKDGDKFKPECSISKVVAQIYTFFNEGMTAMKRLYRLTGKVEDNADRVIQHNKYLGTKETVKSMHAQLSQFYKRTLDEEDYESEGRAQDNYQPHLLHKGLKLDALIEHMMDNIEMKFIVDKGENCIITTSKDDCIQRIAGIVEMKETLEYYIWNRDSGDHKAWVNNFEINRIYKNELELTKLSLQSLVAKLKKIKIPEEVKFDNRKEFRGNLMNVVKCISSFFNIKYWISIVKYSGLKIDSLEDDLHALNGYVFKVDDLIFKVKAHILANQNNEDHKKILTRNPIYKQLEDIIIERS